MCLNTGLWDFFGYYSSHFIWIFLINSFGYKKIYEPQIKDQEGFFFLNFLPQVERLPGGHSTWHDGPVRWPVYSERVAQLKQQDDAKEKNSGVRICEQCSKQTLKYFKCCFSLADDCLRTSLLLWPGTWSVELDLQNSLKETGPGRQ